MSIIIIIMIHLRMQPEGYGVAIYIISRVKAERGYRPPGGMGLGEDSSDGPESPWRSDTISSCQAMPQSDRSSTTD